jgi:hypothetical protein
VGGGRANTAGQWAPIYIKSKLIDIQINGKIENNNTFSCDAAQNYML